jgi:IS30 family transposase
MKPLKDELIQSRLDEDELADFDKVKKLLDVKSRLIIVKRLQGRDSTSITKAILELANQLEDNLKPLTVDHGKEFANYKLIEKQARIPLYFVHAYSPHEWGSNENRNRVLRRFIPKVNRLRKSLMMS